jgi:hypothetical protein
MKPFLVYAFVVAIVFGSIAYIETHKAKTETHRHGNSSAQQLGAEEKLAAELEERDKRKQQEIDRCYKAKGVPALGFGYTVVCIRDNEITEYDPANDAIEVRVVRDGEGFPAPQP